MSLAALNINSSGANGADILSAVFIWGDFCEISPALRANSRVNSVGYLQIARKHQ
jgi:hypothetical protein